MNKNQTEMAIRNIGVFAHVDAGKTTLSERMLVHAGAVSQAGSVDDGTAHTDTLPIERRRGISVKATCVRLQWKGVDINLIDTPGHTDFSAEIERSLWALDGAVLLADAVEGVQPQTEVLFHALHEQHVPVVFFINKIQILNNNSIQNRSKNLFRNSKIRHSQNSFADSSSMQGRKNQMSG